MRGGELAQAGRGGFSRDAGPGAASRFQRLWWGWLPLRSGSGMIRVFIADDQMLIRFRASAPGWKKWTEKNLTVRRRKPRTVRGKGGSRRCSRPGRWTCCGWISAWPRRRTGFEVLARPAARGVLPDDPEFLHDLRRQLRGSWLDGPQSAGPGGGARLDFSGLSLHCSRKCPYQQLVRRRSNAVEQVAPRPVLLLARR